MAPSLLGVLVFTGSLALAQEEAEESGGYEHQDEGVVFEALDETLSQPEFARLSTEPQAARDEASSIPEWLERLLDRIAQALGSRAEEDSSYDLSFNLPGVELLLYAMAAILLAVVVFFIVKSVLAISTDRRIADDEAEARVFRAGSAPGEAPPEEYWRRALEHGEKERYKDGLRELLLGAMSAVERRGVIRFRRGLTNRDYYYSVRGPARESFGFIAS
ncbi:MAG: hypothetical protein ACRD21_28675, partial [Vicinamibacteria bacterium]